MEGDHQEAVTETYAKMWNFMSANPDGFTKVVTAFFFNVVSSSPVECRGDCQGAGSARLLRLPDGEFLHRLHHRWAGNTGSWLFSERNCDLAKVGGELDSKSYGIGAGGEKLVCTLLYSIGEEFPLHQGDQPCHTAPTGAFCNILYILCFIFARRMECFTSFGPSGGSREVPRTARH